MDITVIGGNDDEKDIETHLREDQIQDQSKKARDFFANLQNELDESDGDLKDGLSYLDMKNDTFISYMIDLCNIILRKVRGQSIAGHKSVDRCVSYRVILEKIKMIDQRLAYQLNKLISMPDGQNEDNRGINLEDLDIEVESDGDEEEEGEHATEEEEEEEKSSVDSSQSNLSDADDDEEPAHEEPKQSRGIYKPPKLRSVAYNKDTRKDYNHFYDEDDQFDIVEETTSHRDDERTRYEEENYTRLPDDNPKKAKRKLRTKTLRKKKRR